MTHSSAALFPVFFGERVVVTVGVRYGHKPQFGAVHNTLYRRVRCVLLEIVAE